LSVAELGDMVLRRAWSAVFPALLCLVLIAGLQGCGGASRPFSKSTTPSGRPAPPISVTQMNGLPKDRAPMMVKFLQEAAAQRDIPITAQDFGDSWKLTGDFMPQSEADGTIRLVYGWTLWDGKGQSIHQVSGAEAAGPADADPWTSITPDTLRRVAAFTTESLSSRLSQLGYATQVAGLTPPVDTYARAGPNAENEIDFETLYGSQVASVTPEHRGPVTDAELTGEVDPGADEPARDVAEAEPRPAPTKVAKAVAKAEPVAAREPANDGKKTAIRGVAVTGVSGSPGKGNRELAAAMRKVLEDAGWPVFTKARSDALAISGDVDLGPPQGAVQKVALAWTVKSPDGKVLGTIKQANNIEAGSLDGGWGKTADYAAQAGAEGIFKLVSKLR
jgi:hypothetical protein